MMHKTLSVLLVTLLLGIFPACKKKQPIGQCPVFDETTLNTWFPYTNSGRTYTFANNTGGTQVLTIKSYSSSFRRTITPSVGFEQGIPYCLAEGYIFSDTTAPNSISLYIAHLIERFDDGRLSNGILFQFNTFHYAPMMVSDHTPTVSQESQWGIVSEQKPTLTTPNHSYTDVLALTFTDSSRTAKAKADQLYIAKGYGIVGYRTYPDHKEYWLQ